MLTWLSKELVNFILFILMYKKQTDVVVNNEVFLCQYLYQRVQFLKILLSFEISHQNQTWCEGSSEFGRETVLNPLENVKKKGYFS